MRWLRSLLLLLVAHVASCELQDDARLSPVSPDLVDSFKRQVADVQQQLLAAQQVAGLFSNEKDQLALSLLETKTRMEQEREELQAARREAAAVIQEVAESSAQWKKTIEALRAVNTKNREMLTQMTEQKEKELEEQQLELKRLDELRRKKIQEQRELQQEMERQERLRQQQIELQKQKEKELRREEEKRQRELEKQHAMEMKGQQEAERVELQRQQELKKQEELKKLQEKEKEDQRKQQEAEKQAAILKQQQLKKQEELQQQAQAKAKTTKLEEAARGAMDKPSESESSAGVWKYFVSWYLSAERVAYGATAEIVRQMVFPVVLILLFFLVATVGISWYNNAQRARRRPRVLYSGYPKSYRAKSKTPDAATLRARRAARHDFNNAAETKVSV